MERDLGAPAGDGQDGPLTLCILSVNGKLTYSLDLESFLQPRGRDVVPETEFRMSHDHPPDGNSPEVAGTIRRRSNLRGKT